jgi:peptide/nickel transport system ATP-binding protein
MSDAPTPQAPVLQVDGLVKHFPVTRGLIRRRVIGNVRAVEGVTFEIARGETLALVGESGCGKSTTGKLVLGLIPATAGTVRYAGNEMPPAGSAAWRALRPRMQMVYQDPLGALDRRLPVGVQIMEPLTIHGQASPAERRERAAEVMTAVGLQKHQFDRYPHELSGGQRQRVVLARALMTEPDLLVCDEPISALDVSIQAQVVNLLLDLQERLGIAYLFISHDLRVVRQVSHEVAVMYLGRIVEQGEAESLFAQPTHPYTRALVSAIPVLGPRRERLLLQGDPPNPVDVPSGCAFHTRCPFAVAACRAETPTLRRLADGRQVACHRVDEPALQAAA